LKKNESEIRALSVGIGYWKSLQRLSTQGMSVP
jgi:hypothetical protein